MKKTKSDSKKIANECDLLSGREAEEQVYLKSLEGWKRQQVSVNKGGRQLLQVVPVRDPPPFEGRVSSMWVSVDGVERQQVWAWVLLGFGCVLRGTRHYRSSGLGTYRHGAGPVDGMTLGPNLECRDAGIRSRNLCV